MESYVYDGVEVKKTGRIAVREIKQLPGKVNKHYLHEIQPVDPDIDWKKWVNPEHLYVVTTNKE